jgi:CO/xanthine dehydrogenase FAD-binding subunit
MTLDAAVELASAEGVRTVPVTDLFIADGIWNTVRRPDEVLTRVLIPLPAPGSRAAYTKLRQRNAIDFPLLNVAVSATLAEDGTVGGMRMVVSALGSRPRMVSGLDAIVAGQRLDAEVIDRVAQRAHQQCYPLTNIIVDADWRRAMVPVYVRRALEDLTAR